jgi:hypothetical protein
MSRHKDRLRQRCVSGQNPVTWAKLDLGSSTCVGRLAVSGLCNTPYPMAARFQPHIQSAGFGSHVLECLACY